MYYPKAMENLADLLSLVDFKAQWADLLAATYVSSTARVDLYRDMQPTPAAKYWWIVRSNYPINGRALPAKRATKPTSLELIRGGHGYSMPISLQYVTYAYNAKDPVAAMVLHLTHAYTDRYQKPWTSSRLETVCKHILMLDKMGL